MCFFVHTHTHTHIYIFNERMDCRKEERIKGRKTPSDYMINSGSEKRLSKYTAIWYISPPNLYTSFIYTIKEI